ncbi:hypothetical protein CBER1_11812 [Cercospora berteroae]|uniref:Uncharacterized protein n=1 Tax=Cercospora berteroae TaxID=357750 RepID=A0A2S6CMJ9_9PEZI|nr:hypothetical protein CBER1_11812 [Cercospora berteroae]
MATSYQQDNCTTGRQSGAEDNAAHPGTPVENVCWRYEWTTSECEAADCLIDELRIFSCQNATISEDYKYYITATDLPCQIQSLERTRKIVHPTERYAASRQASTITSASTSCDSLALSSRPDTPEQYDFFHDYERDWDTRSITDCGTASIPPQELELKPVRKTDSGYWSYQETENIMSETLSISSSYDSGKAMDTNTICCRPLQARNSLDLDHNGICLCNSKRTTTPRSGPSLSHSNKSFEVIEERLDWYLVHRNSLDLDQPCRARKSPAAKKSRGLKERWAALKAAFSRK